MNIQKPTKEDWIERLELLRQTEFWNKFTKTDFNKIISFIEKEISTAKAERTKEVGEEIEKRYDGNLYDLSTECYDALEGLKIDIKTIQDE